MKKMLKHWKIGIQKYIKLSWKLKIIVIAVFFLTGITRLAILVVPPKYLLSILGKEGSETPEEVNRRELLRAYKIGWCVNKVSDYTPWQSKCLVEALTAQLLLKTLGISSTLYLGISREGENKLIAHAWLRCGQLIVTGGDEKEHFKTVAKYASK